MVRCRPNTYSSLRHSPTSTCGGTLQSGRTSTFRVPCAMLMRSSASCFAGCPTYARKTSLDGIPGNVAPPEKLDIAIQEDWDALLNTVNDPFDGVIMGEWLLLLFAALPPSACRFYYPYVSCHCPSLFRAYASLTASAAASPVSFAMG